VRAALGDEGARLLALVAADAMVVDITVRAPTS